MINKEIQDYIDYLLFLKYDRQLVWSNTTIAKMSDKHLVNAIKYLEQHNPNHNMLAIMYKERDYRCCNCILNYLFL